MPNSNRKMLDECKQIHEKLLSQEKLASLGELTAGIAHEIRNPLNLVNNFAKLSDELFEELKQKVNALSSPNAEMQRDIAELISMLKENLIKIIDQGQRAERIIEGILAIARGKPGEMRIVMLPELVEDTIKLSFQAMRSRDSTFNIKIEREYAEDAKAVECISEDIQRVLVNLLNNAFYSTHQKKKDLASPDYQPTVRIHLEDLNDKVALTVYDNGNGMSEEVKQKIFTPFFSTKPNHEGTGLGLSVSDEIIQAHHGRFIVDTKENEYASFKIILHKVISGG